MSRRVDRATANSLGVVDRPAVVHRRALSITEACAALGVSWDFWREHVEPDVRIVRAGRRKLVPVFELDRWLDDHAERALGTGISAPTAHESPANGAMRARRASAKEPA